MSLTTLSPNELIFYYSYVRLKISLGSFALLHAALIGQPAFAQTNTLGLADGFLSFNTSTFSIQFVKDSQTLYSLKAQSNGFDFIPTDQMTARQGNANYHLGDLTFRVRKSGSTAWINGDTSTARKPVLPLPASGSIIAAANLSPTLPSNSLVNVTRQWVVANGVLQLQFAVQNTQNVPVEIGALGMPLEFNNVRQICECHIFMFADCFSDLHR